MYQGYYRVIKVRGNQLDVAPTEGGPTKTIHVKHAKVVLPVDRVVDSIPDYTKFGRKSKLTVNPEKILDLNWELTTRISTLTLPTTTASCDNVSNSSHSTKCIVTSAAGTVTTSSIA